METHSLARALAQNTLLTKLSMDHLEFLSGCAKNVRISAGEYLFREGEDANELFLIRRGVIALEVYAPPRSTMSAETVGSGDLLGWSVLFPPHTWSIDARVLEDALLFSIDGACLRKKLEADHDFGYHLMRVVLEHVHRRLERLRLQQLDVYRTESI